MCIMTARLSVRLFFCGFVCLCARACVCVAPLLPPSISSAFLPIYEPVCLWSFSGVSEAGCSSLLQGISGDGALASLDVSYNIRPILHPDHVPAARISLVNTTAAPW